MRRLDEAAPAYDEEEVYPTGNLQVVVKNPEAIYEGPGAPWFRCPSPAITDERLSVGARLYYVFAMRAAYLKEEFDNETISAKMTINARAGEKYRDELRKLKYFYRDGEKTVLQIDRTP